MGQDISEGQFVQETFSRLSKIPGICACKEVPILGRSVDVAFALDDDLWSVEFKIKNWRKAISQARDHRLGVDYSYICIPRRTPSISLLSALAEARVGLLFPVHESDWPFEIVVEAPKSDESWIVARNNVLDHLEKEGGI